MEKGWFREESAFLYSRGWFSVCDVEPVLEYRQSGKQGSTLENVATLLLIAAWLWCVIGLALILFSRWDIESIVVTGPTLELIGLTTIGFGLAGRSLWATLVALGPVCFPIGIFMLIYSMEWGPGEARRPVTWLVVGFLVVFFSLVLSLSIVGWKRR